MSNFKIKGFKFSAVQAGVKKAGRLDFALIFADAPATAAGVTTTNLVFAAPVGITRERLKTGSSRAILVNSGNANAYTGEKGYKDALTLTGDAAEKLGIDPDQVLVMSTGVIGLHLPMDRMLPKIEDLVDGLSPDAFMDVASAILTTDTNPKIVEMEISVGGGTVKIAGMAKGAGMIAPKMATMLSVLMTDADVEADFLQETFARACSRTFNCITIDGDTSTNDTAVIMASGASGIKIEGDSARKAFSDMLDKACMSLARQIVLDGEGATKLVEVNVVGAAAKEEASIVARHIAESPLVKTAFNGSDPNWGRIICAAGRAGVAFDPDRIDLSIGDVVIVKNGTIVEGDWETAAHSLMKNREFTVTLDLKAGQEEAFFLTTDLSKEYVSINADYRS